MDGGYDDNYRLTSEVRKDSGDATLYSNDFLYDPAGNRMGLVAYDGETTTTVTSSYNYNTADQLTKSTAGVDDTTYAYDALRRRIEEAA